MFCVVKGPDGATLELDGITELDEPGTLLDEGVLDETVLDEIAPEDALLLDAPEVFPPPPLPPQATSNNDTVSINAIFFLYIKHTQ